jgi:hypothetical protein
MQKYTFRDFRKSSFGRVWIILAPVCFVIQLLTLFTLFTCDSCPTGSSWTTNQGYDIQVNLNCNWVPISNFHDSKTGCSIINDWTKYDAFTQIYNGTITFVDKVHHHECDLIHLYVHLALFGVWILPFWVVFIRILGNPTVVVKNGLC